ncbi:DNA gyrase inhibitor YacG [Methylobacterium gregans]|uniref:DNA gyrase inhibitor YacG n=1 Tax=Methylobacterium gregans TaxID=374424 RepID=A0AA37HKQ0_9HYPH|nr:DNA gyrase inhibitor YacG [Methylobacterium gregans]MDQ0523391.1 endogenous inhibitor of DNA gyrase (YacG/DUF329 family) [Methylobacterium gregans]GJD77256.1 DNA gyrase inhibitor YacG [Methylobacterium gregans]GLS56014.1 DNA gyrase inhibitor YacG [Methylobacterium gregans]
MSTREAPAPCPICGKSAAPAYKPFCSQRCADVDLGRWLSDRYVIPGEDQDDTGPSPHDDQNEKT